MRESVNSRTLFIIYNDMGLGGVQKKIVDLIENISGDKKSSIKKIYLLLSRRRQFELKDDLFLRRIKKQKVVVLRSPQVHLGKLRFPFSLYVFGQVFKHKPDVILTFMRKYIVISVLIKKIFYKRRIKVVAGFDNIATMELTDYVKNPLLKLFWKKLVASLFPQSDVLIVPSDAAKYDLINNFNISKNKIKVNKNWVTIRPREELKINNNKLIYVGRIDPQKNIGRMIGIIEKVRKFIPKVRLDIVGNGNEVSVIKKDITAKKLESNVKLLGSKDNIRKHLSAAKIFLLTSNFEGLPISALEAMSYKLPVVTTDYPGASELIINGKTGYVCRSDEEYVDKVVQLLKNPKRRNKMGNAALNYVKKFHSEKNLAAFTKLLFK